MQEIISNWKFVIFQNYTNFSGRAGRREYWLFVLANVLVAIVLGLIDTLIGKNILGALYSLAVILPGIAVSVRRLHDLGKSGWYILLGLIPIIGALYLIYLFIQEGQKEANEYGEEPKAVQVEA